MREREKLFGASKGNVVESFFKRVFARDFTSSLDRLTYVRTYVREAPKNHQVKEEEERTNRDNKRTSLLEKLVVANRILAVSFRSCGG